MGQWDPLERGIAASVGLAAVLRAIAALTQPNGARASLALTTGILLVHAALYGGGTALRARWLSPVGYVAVQAGMVFGFAMLAPPLPFALALYVALTAHALRLLAGRCSPALVTSVATALFATSTTLTSNLYRGASVALVLSLVGAVVHAVRGASRRDNVKPAGGHGDGISVPARLRAPAPGVAGPTLTAREIEVLRLAAEGARNQTIAERLGISERTVKAHLASAYGKLGVESRAAATAIATQRGILS